MTDRVDQFRRRPAQKSIYLTPPDAIWSDSDRVIVGGPKRAGKGTVPLVWSPVYRWIECSGNCIDLQQTKTVVVVEEHIGHYGDP